MSFSQAFTIHQYHHTATSHDAISNYLFWIQKSLHDAGISGEIFASKISDLPPNSVKPFEKSKLWNCDLLLIHHSQGNPLLDRLIDIEVPKAVIYNNITPSHFFKHDSFLENLSRLGRSQLKILAKETSAGFGTSDFNCRELEENGFLQPQKLPLLEIPNAPESPSRNFQKGKPIQLLFVGRIARHKNQALLIKTFYYLKDRLPENSSLVLVGKGDPIYSKYLRLLIKQLGLSKHITLTGKISDSELATLYAKSTALICPSLHEGFCIPLVEAMKVQLPIFAVAADGVAETLGDSGLLMHTDRPHEIAAILANAFKNSELMNPLSESSGNRLKSLSEFHNSKILVSRLQQLAERIRTTPPHQKKRSHEPLR